MEIRKDRKRTKVTVPAIDMERNMILRFRGSHGFLSNFYPCKNEVEFEGDLYPTSENAYQAAKFDASIRYKFKHIHPSKAKRLSRSLPVRDDFDREKIKIMRQILESKFTRDPTLRKMLLATGDMILVEGTTWGDRFWGVDLREPCTESKFGYSGRNMLGQLLMEIREEMKSQ